MLRDLFCIVWAPFWTGVCFFGTLFGMLFSFSRSGSMPVVRGPWSRGLVWAGGGKLEVRGAENVDMSKPHIFVSNHQSTVDIPVLFIALPADVRFAAKAALKYVPFIGWYMWLARFVFVDRGNHRAAVASLDRAAEQIRGGISIIMFPEGTRSDDARVMPFKKGPFALAMKAGVPIVPVAIEGSGKLMPKNSWHISPGPITVTIGKPIDPAQFNGDRDALIRTVRNFIIAQNVAMGGKGGDVQDNIAARGHEGVSERTLNGGGES
jgi:1-acyl-sn-glycerol-3-phosphate acyltransferase